VIGPLDDVVAVVLLLRYAARSIPRPALLAAWPAEPRLLERVLDGRRKPAASTQPTGRGEPPALVRGRAVPTDPPGQRDQRG